MVSTIPSGSGKHTLTHLHETQNTLVPLQTTHGGTLCSWVGWTIFGRGGGWPRAEATFCGAVLLSDLLWNLSDSLWLAHVEGAALFGKHPWIFWQNHSQLQGQNVVCVSLWVCLSLMSRRLDGRRGQPWVLHHCWGLWNWFGRNTEVFFCLGSICYCSAASKL